MTEQQKTIRPEDQPGFFVLKHYLTDMSFENPRGPLEERQCADIKKKLTVGVDTREEQEADMVLLTLSLEAQYQGRIVFLCDISYCAHVRMNKIPEQMKAQILHVSVPTSLIPFLNNAIDHAARAAGYPGLKIGDIDFMGLYQEKNRKQQVH